MTSETLNGQKNTPDLEKKVYTVEERWKILIDVVLRDAMDKASAKLPQEGLFAKIKIGLIYPDDKEIYGLLNLEPGSNRLSRVARVGAYRHGTDRLVSNFFLFDSTQALLDWLTAEDTGAKLIEAYQHLRERVE